MSNNYTTSITFYGDNRDELRRFYEKLSAVSKGSLNNIGNAFGIDCNDDVCHGDIETIGDMFGNQFEISQVDAQRPNTEFWSKLLDEKYPSIEFVYIAEEPVSGVYINSDIDGRYYSQLYIVDAILPKGSRRIKQSGEVYEYFDSTADVLDFIEEVTGKIFKSISEGQSYIQTFCDFKGEDYFFYVHAFEEDFVNYTERLSA